MMRAAVVLAALLIAGPLSSPLALAAPAAPAKGAKSGSRTESGLSASTLSALKFRSIGPAVNSGRISDLAVDPRDPSVWYVAAAYGGVWKTTNAGTTFEPIFDDQGTSSIGCVTLAPSRPLTVWVGTGENNSQRSVGWGDGVYRSDDGGRNWTNMGLKASEHIGRIVVHPTNPDVVWVASQGPLWASGGDRGVYKTTDGGRTWKRVLHVDDWTGANEVHLDPHDPNVLYASTYQRHRKVWTLVNGGPGSGLWKSVDGGETWTRLKNGLPGGDMGRIGLVVPPNERDVIVATVEASADSRGTYRSEDGGANWSKLNGQVSSSPQYYQELFADPNDRGRLYMIDTFLQASDDGGRTWKRAGEANKHVDNHVVWVDPRDSRHLIVGCDGGLYETFDRCATWNFFANLPITQFYKVEVDQDLPFFNVYGGTQDNATWGGPSRTANDHGIRNSDWWFVLGGDGFQPRVDPTDPNIVYGSYQHGELYRFDRRSGERTEIQPQPEPGEPGSRWNWDSPLIISPHSHKRLYFASQRVYRSDDRGDTWRAVSPDLTAGIDRNRLPVMGRVQSVDAIAKNMSTSIYGNIVWVDESPLAEGLLVVGTDDGLVWVSEDAGANWRRVDTFPGVGPYAYVSRVVPSRHARNTLFATFDRHKMGDFKPYVLRSDDLGRTWTNVSGDLPANGSVYAFVEDHQQPGLWFVGTEFGVFVTPDAGRRWVQLKGGLPVACIRDLAIQRRDDALVVCTFSRGFYVLDDLAPLRALVQDGLRASSHTLLPVRDALMFVPGSPMGGSGKAEQGASFYVAENPPVGAVFHYWLRDGYKSLRDQRRSREKDLAKSGGDAFYPSWDSLRAEDREEAPAIVLTVSDAQGRIVRRLTGPAGAGLQRVVWDFRRPDPSPASLEARTRGDWESAGGGPLVAPGRYQVAMAVRARGTLTTLGEPRSFTVKPLENVTLPAPDRTALAAFQEQAAELQRSLEGTQRLLGEAQQAAQLLRKALDEAPSPEATALREQAVQAIDRLRGIGIRLNGDAEVRRREEATPPSIADRVGRMVEGSFVSTSAPTSTQRRAYDIGTAELARVVEDLRAVLADLRTLGDRAEAVGASWTPGRIPTVRVP